MCAQRMGISLENQDSAIPLKDVTVSIMWICIHTLSRLTRLTRLTRLFIDSVSLIASLKSWNTCQRLRRSTLKLCKIIYKPNPAMIPPMWTLWWQLIGNVSQWHSKECKWSGKCRSVVARSHNGSAVSSPAYCSVVSTWSFSWIAQRTVGPIMRIVLWRNNLLHSALPYEYIHQMYICLIYIYDRCICYVNNDKYI